MPNRNVFDFGTPVNPVVDVKNLDEVTDVLEAATVRIENATEETTEELRKVTLGAGLITGTDLDEEVI